MSDKKPQPERRPSPERKPQPVKRQAPIVLISMGLMAAVLITMLILVIVPHNKLVMNSPVIAIVDAKGNVPSLSLQHTMHAAGYNVEYIHYGQELPQARYVIVMGIGSEALAVINEYKDEDNVAGFVLVCPELNEDYLTGLSSLEPECDIAIFAGRNDVSSVTQMKGPRVIYERISGDDTLFGTPVRRGGLFASKVYFNNMQNRMLSLSCFKINDPGKLLFSPLFQNELAGYLSVTYIDEAVKNASFGSINAWFVFCWLSVALAVVSVLLYISNMSLSVTGNDPKKAPVSKWVFGLIGGISIAVAIGIIATSFSERLRSSMPLIQVLVPEVFMLCLFVINFSWITTRDGKFVPSKKTQIPAVFLAFVIGLYAMFITFLTADIKVYAISDAGISSGILTLLLIVDTMFATGLIYASRKSSTAGQGAKNMFGNRLILALMFIPCAAALLFGLIPGNTAAFYAGLSGLAALGLPYLAVLPLVRHTDRSLIPGILHGVVFILVLAAVL